MKQRCSHLSFFSGVTLLSLSSLAPAQTAPPNIASVSPTGGQRGTTVSLTLTGVHIGQGTGLLFEGGGLTIEEVKGEKAPDNAKNPNGTLSVKVRIAPDAEPGIRVFRAVTPQGVSNTALFVVGQWPETVEKEGNNTPETAQEISTPAIILGKMDSGEDVDCYRLRLKAGQTLVCEVLSARIGAPLDSVLTLRDSALREVAINEDYFGSDSLLTFTPEKDGDYTLMLRDLSYRGGGEYGYRLTVGAIPYLTAIFPMGGAAGASLDTTLEGFNLGQTRTQRITLPQGEPDEPMSLTLPVASALSNTVLAALGSAPEVSETEPNDRVNAAQSLSVPQTVNGRIVAARASMTPDADYYRFSGTAGRKLILEVQARRIGSRLDSQLAVFDLNGKELATNDDALGKDSRLEFAPPQNGDYVVRVSNLTGQQGAEYFYRLLLRPAEPDFRLTFTPDRPAIWQGGRVPLTVMVERLNGFDGEIALEFPGLPQGVTVLGAPRLGKGQNEVNLVLSASPDAPLAAGGWHVAGLAKIGSRDIRRVGKPRIETFVKENDQIQRRLNPAKMPVAAVAAAPDLVVTATPEAFALSPGKSVEITVKIARRPGFDAKVPLAVVGMPAGVTAAPLEIPEKQTEVKVIFKADDKITPGDIRLLIVGKAVLDELRHVPHASLPLMLTLSK